MFGIGTTELLVILVVALIVVGPKQLPKIARTLGKAMGEFKRVSTDLHRTINVEMEREEREQRAKKEEQAKLKAEKEAPPAQPDDPAIKAEKAYASAVAANTLPKEEKNAAAAVDDASALQEAVDVTPSLASHEQDASVIPAQPGKAKEQPDDKVSTHGDKA